MIGLKMFISSNCASSLSNASTARLPYILTPLSAFICVSTTNLYVMPRNSPRVGLYPAHRSSNIGGSQSQILD